MAHNVESDVSVQRFGYIADDDGRRLKFPRAVTHNVTGRVGAVSYGGKDLIFDGLEGRLDTLRWTSDAMSIGGAWLRDDAGRYDIVVDRIEMPRGIMLTRADRGVEIMAPHVSLSEMKMTIKGPFSSTPKMVPLASEAPSLRQDHLHFLDSLTGRIYLTVKVVLDLPVIGKRTLDQQLRVPVQEGSLDYRALENSLDWLEGAFLDIKHQDDRLAITWKVPIVGSSRDLISWKLDNEATTLASFGRVPVRSLADFRTKKKTPESDNKGGVLKSLSLDAIDIALSLVAPRSVDAAGGLIMFGGDDSPGMVDLKVSGAINDSKPGVLRGTIGSIDTTIKDVHLGPVVLTADRLHFDGLDELEVVFDGFKPSCVTVIVHRITATNLSLKLSGKS
ncbi:MAG: hypothetical protein M4D80_34960 [Myxococcota bacterium]|nr:hypothetical protein [Deltaproteobacteria bacterium]MDQ3340388.1 hypothetical protein [Myxococcota bacterium]